MNVTCFDDYDRWSIRSGRFILLRWARQKADGGFGTLTNWEWRLGYLIHRWGTTDLLGDGSYRETTTQILERFEFRFSGGGFAGRFSSFRLLPAGETLGPPDSELLNRVTGISKPFQQPPQS
jgi:hypothetical protein